MLVHKPSEPALQLPLAQEWGNSTVENELSCRARDIFLATATGRSNSEISPQLHLTRATVRTRVDRILAKLHLRDRVHAVIVAYGLRVL
jgi:DNA-binding NarL/FixJ family response regulator